MKSNSEIRAAARASLGKSIFSDRWIMGLVIYLISTTVVSLLSSFVIGFLLVGPLLLAINYIYLRLARGAEKIELGDLLYGCSDGRLARSLLLYILQTLYLTLWSLLLVIPGIIKAYSYRLAYFVMLDNPEMSANECITESRRLMDGYKMQAFLLDLSFIGWLLLGSLACGIGVLFVEPYMQAAHAAFYEEILAGKNGTAAPTAEAE